MAVTIPNHYGEAQWIFTSTSGTQPFVTTLGVSLGDATLLDLTEMANQCFTAYSTSFLGLTSDIMILDHVNLQVNIGGSIGSVSSTHASEAGAITSGLQAPFNLAPLINKFTANLGRKGRGRMFLPGALPAGDVNTDGSIATAYREELSSTAADFLAAINDSETATPMTAVLLHDDPAMPPSEILALQAANLVGAIRKRIR